MKKKPMNVLLRMSSNDLLSGSDGSAYFIVDLTRIFFLFPGSGSEWDRIDILIKILDRDRYAIQILGRGSVRYAIQKNRIGVQH